LTFAFAVAMAVYLGKTKPDRKFGDSVSFYSGNIVVVSSYLWVSLVVIMYQNQEVGENKRTVDICSDFWENN